MNRPRLADPVLPLQTMNAHCVAVRMAALEAANPAQLPPEELERLANQAQLFVHALKDGYRTCRGDESMQARYETACKAVQRVLYGLRAKAGQS